MYAISGAGAYGTSYSGGSGGGGTSYHNSYTSSLYGYDATSYGGSGGDGKSAGDGQGMKPVDAPGGAGNPAGKRF